MADLREYAVALQAMKGSAYALAWGFSLDYVPHMTGRKVAWHRTSRSSRLDLRHDPLDYLGAEEDVHSWLVHSLFGAKQAAMDAHELTARAMPMARAFFDAVERVEDLPEAFERQRLRRAVRFGFHNYVQQPLAYLFTLRRLGRGKKAKDLLERYVRDYRVAEEAATRLRALLAA